MLILHGDNLVQSRHALQAEIEKARANQHLIQVAVAKSLSFADLEKFLFTDSLFAEPRFLVIEELHSMPKSAKRDQFIELIGKASTQPELSLILWDKKPLLVSDLKKFPHAATRAFPASKVMFQWLDTFSGKATETQISRSLTLLHQAIDQDGADFCLTMAGWKVRQLLEVHAGRTASGKPPNPRAAGQARTFTPDQLWKLHQRLTELDLKYKTSGLLLDLPQELALLQLSTAYT